VEKWRCAAFWAAPVWNPASNLPDTALFPLYRSRRRSTRFFSCLVCYASGVADASSVRNSHPRHAAFVRVTHWVTAICFFALLLSGVEIVISHPRFYWGETGNVLTRPLFQIPIPSSRAMVPTGYGYVLPDQNGWSRYLHFQAAWAAVLTGFVYVIWGLWTGHFRSNLFPAPADRTWKAFLGVMAKLKPFRTTYFRGPHTW
jgi:thiosulfate reductase cytochrome b subunit